MELFCFIGGRGWGLTDGTSKPGQRKRGLNDKTMTAVNRTTAGQGELSLARCGGVCIRLGTEPGLGLFVVTS